jgi:hypothetical protein
MGSRTVEVIMFSLAFLPPAVANFLVGQAGGSLYESALALALVAIIFVIVFVALT